MSLQPCLSLFCPAQSRDVSTSSKKGFTRSSHISVQGTHTLPPPRVTIRKETIMSITKSWYVLQLFFCCRTEKLLPTARLTLASESHEKAETTHRIHVRSSASSDNDMFCFIPSTRTTPLCTTTKQTQPTPYVRRTQNVSKRLPETEPACLSQRVAASCTREETGRETGVLQVSAGRNQTAVFLSRSETKFSTI